jgi:hypothetical protein
MSKKSRYWAQNSIVGSGTKMQAGFVERAGYLTDCQSDQNQSVMLARIGLSDANY